MTGSLSTARYPQVIAHRGASGHAFENSMHALALALDLGCDGVEIDVHATRDGEIVVHHDSTMITGQAIADLSAREVREILLHDDTPVPLLSEVLAQLSSRMQVHVEAKGLPPSADARLLELIRGAPRAEAVHVHAFDHRIIARLRAQSPSLALGVLSGSYPLDPVGPVVAAGADTLWQEHHLIDADLMARCTDAGVRVMAWTVNSRSDAERLIALGVAGLCGNWPERLRPLAE